MNASLTLTDDQHRAPQDHLFPGDGKEAVAFLLCGQAAHGDRHRLVVHQVVTIPHKRCKRSVDRVSWDGEDLVEHLDHAAVDRLSLVKVHSHPGGYAQFSAVDDESDHELLPTIASWAEHEGLHGSAIMLPNGWMFGRVYQPGRGFVPMTLINVVGPDLRFWWHETCDEATAPSFAPAQDQAFGGGTTQRLQRLRIGIVGASGTGSPVLEQLVRLGVGHVVLVDDDRVEDRNLNRIMFATQGDANHAELKVRAAKSHVDRIGLGTAITPIAAPVESADAIHALAQCDVLFGCVDTLGGRFTMNVLATHYLLPYFDLGILLDAEQTGDERGRIKDIVGTVHYLIPGRSSLMSREVFTMADVSAEGLRRRDPDAAQQQEQDKYIKGMAVRRPAVISVNMFAASLAVNDFLARLHPYRKLGHENAAVAAIEFSLAELRLTQDEELTPCSMLAPMVGRGDRTPLLSMPRDTES